MTESNFVHRHSKRVNITLTLMGGNGVRTMGSIPAAQITGQMTESDFVHLHSKTVNITLTLIGGNGVGTMGSIHFFGNNGFTSWWDVHNFHQSN